MLVGGKVNGICLQSELMEQMIELIHPFDMLYAASLSCLFLGQLVTFPDRDFFIRLAYEQDFPVLFNLSIRKDEQNAFLLGDAGQVKEIIVLFEWQGRVRIA